MSKKSIEEMYLDTLSLEDDFDDIYGNDEIESVITSRDVVKHEQDLEEKGIKPPDYSRVEETAHFHLYGKRRVHKYTESEMRAIEESCESSIVHDFGEHDMYHLSNEERLKNDMLAEIDMKLSRLRRSYSKVDQYIEAMRVVVEAWEILSKKNFLHTSKEFFKMVGEGRITSSRIIMPKLKKADRYNMETLIKYISNPELDPSELVPIQEEKPDDFLDSFYFDIDDVKDEKFRAFYFEFIENYKKDNGIGEDEYFDEDIIKEDAVKYANNQIAAEKTERLISAEEAEILLDHDADNPETTTIRVAKPSYIKGYDRRGNSISKKKFNKRERYFIGNLHEMLLKIQNNPAYTKNTDMTKTYLITNGLFDTDKAPRDIFDDLIFKGSWSDEAANWLFDRIVDEELLRQTPSREDYRTYGDKELAKFFKILDENKMSALAIELQKLMNRTPEDEKRRENMRTKKENKKIEADLLQRITKLNESEKFKKIVEKAEDSLRDTYKDL